MVAVDPKTNRITARPRLTATSSGSDWSRCKSVERMDHERDREAERGCDADQHTSVLVRPEADRVRDQRDEHPGGECESCVSASCDHRGRSAADGRAAEAGSGG